MKIGIDLRPLVMGAGGGISQLTKGVCEHMFPLATEHQFFIFCTPFNRSLLDYTADHVHFFSLPVSAFYPKLDRIASTENLDVLFRAYPVEDNLQFPLKKQIFLIPDNQHETFPEFFTSKVLCTRRIAFSKALKEAGAIGTISEFAKKELLSFHETSCRDVFLMPPSLQVVHKAARDKVELSDSERALIPQTDYFLFPANLWKHKNHHRLLKAFSQFYEKCERRNTKLILTGHPDGWSELVSEFRNLPVKHLGFVRAELLRVLLEHARALVFFSLYEGFGMPLLEAFDAGTPVICSNTTSLPEVGGDAVLSCDPTDVDAISELMMRISVDDELRVRLTRCGKKRLSHYSWDKSAYNLIAACERVAKSTTHLYDKHSEIKNPLPLVSIVTPSYNQGQFIRETIDSVLSQSYPKIEYIVIDGGSSDGTIEILRSYGDKIDWVSEPDQGQTNAINKGMALMKGEIRAYLNSDDILVPDAVEKIVHFFNQNPDCDMVYGNADYIDKKGQIIGKYNTENFSSENLFKDCIVCQPAAFWKSRITDKIGPFDEQLNYTMDYDYWLRIVKAGGNICYVPEKLASSRLYKENKTLSARSNIYKEIFDICKRHIGHTHRNYYIGYWQYLIFESDNIGWRILGFIPYSHFAMGWIHFILVHPSHFSMRNTTDFLLRKVKHRIRRSGSARRMIRFVKINFLSSGESEQPKSIVLGFGRDNWLEPLVRVPSKKRVTGHILHIAGIAPVDLVMTIRAGKNEIHSSKFKAKQYKKISFPAEAVGNKSLTIHFSNFIEDSNKQRLSFYLQDTNIFAESDI